MNGLSLPRGRTTDALVAILFVAAVMQLLPVVAAAVMPYGFMPLDVVSGAWRSDPVRTVLSPLVSQFLVMSIVATLLNLVFLLIAGRYVERAIGPVGLVLLFVAGAYGGAIARLALTPQSFLVTADAGAALFAWVGAYFMLYGVPAVLPVPTHYGRAGQIAALAALWAVIQLVFMVAAGAFEVSLNLINPLGGLAAGMLLSRPLLRWRYRKA